jgi:hydroxymethylpyrimidine/phosphomethylpyrimidine kinase
LTVQSTVGVFGVEQVQARTVAETLRRLADDVEIAGVRIGMLGSGAVAEAVSSYLEERKPKNVVLDPVIRSSSGADLIDEAGLEVLRRRLLPLCDLVTPNVEEAAEMAGSEPVSTSGAWEETVPRLRILAWTLHDRGCRAVVITGGHLVDPHDFLSYQTTGGRREEILVGSRIESTSTHGTGCAFAMAAACELAKKSALPDAVRAAKNYVRRAIESAYPVGKGSGPINHLFQN